MITVNAVGDIMLTDNMRGQFAPYGADYFFSDVQHILRDADFTIGNLECPLSDRGKPYINKDFLFRASPDFAKSLKFAGFNIVSLANNHVLDYGPLALFDTINHLNAHGISCVGAGRNLQEAGAPLITRTKGITTALFAFTYAYPAKKRRPGCAPSDLHYMQTQIRNIRPIVDLVIVSLHVGVEFVDYPARQIMSLFRGVVDAGANLVLGHHPHVVQGLESYKGALICYSLGNFVSDCASEKIREEAYKTTALAYFTDHPPAVDDLRTIETFILQCKLSSHGIVDYKLIPIKIKEDFRPIAMDERESPRFLRRVKEISDKLSEPNDPIWDEMDDLLEKCKMFSLQNIRVLDILWNVFCLRPRHFKLALPLLKAKLSRDLKAKSQLYTSP